MFMRKQKNNQRLSNASLRETLSRCLSRRGRRQLVTIILELLTAVASARLVILMTIIREMLTAVASARLV